MVQVMVMAVVIVVGDGGVGCGRGGYNGGDGSCRSCHVDSSYGKKF